MRNGAPNGEAIAEINVTPLVDIILVVLIIFMVSAPIIARRAIQVNIPQASHHERAATKALTIALNQRRELYLAGRRVNEEELSEELKAAQLDVPDLHVTFSADTGLPYGQVVKILDLARGAGVRHIGLEVSPK